MEDLWGEDIDADVVEECVMLATQASFCPSPSKNNKPETSSSDNKNRTIFEFKQPTVGNQFVNKKGLSISSNPSPKIVDRREIASLNSVDDTELQLLRNENQRLSEANLVKNGETSILRSDLQNLRFLLEKKEAEASHQLSFLNKQVQELNSQNNKLLESSRTELKFKELELEELRNKCKRLEQTSNKSAEGLPNNKKSPSTSSFCVQEFSAGKRPSYRTTFPREGKVQTLSTGVQTELFKHFQLHFGDRGGLNSNSDTSILVENLKFCLLSNDIALLPYSTLLEQLKIRMIYCKDKEKLAKVFSGSDVNVAEIVCKKLEQDKSTDRLNLHLEFLSCWITNILPILDSSTQEQFIQVVLSEIKRSSCLNIMVILCAIIPRFGLSSICNRPSGCLLEKVALNLKEAYLSMKVEDQIQTSQKLVLMLSAIVASPNSSDVKKCACIPHLLKLLVFTVQHQAELEGLTSHFTGLRFKMLVQAFRLCISILNSRCEPWVTFKHSSTELNRLYTVLTISSVEFSLPKDISYEINVAAFTLPGFGL